MEFLIQNYGFIAFIGGLLLSVGGLFWENRINKLNLINHENRLLKMENKVDNLSEINVTLKFLKISFEEKFSNINKILEIIQCNFSKDIDEIKKKLGL